MPKAASVPSCSRPSTHLPRRGAVRAAAATLASQTTVPSASLTAILHRRHCTLCRTHRRARLVGVVSRRATPPASRPAESCSAGCLRCATPSVARRGAGPSPFVECSRRLITFSRHPAAGAHGDSTMFVPVDGCTRDSGDATPRVARRPLNICGRHVRVLARFSPFPPFRFQKQSSNL